MKLCPQCNRIETDESLKFCRVDGATLIIDSRSVSEEAGTAKFDSGSVPSEIKTSVLPHRTDAEINRATAPTTTLPAAAAPGTTSGLIKAERRGVVFGLIAVVALGVAIGGYFYFSRKATPAIQSIAVMPFVNESGNSDVEYLSDGMTESLINSLSQLPKVNVKARSSVFRYKGKEVDPQTVGKELDVQAIVNGRVVQRGDDLTLYLSLVETRTGNQLWGEQYNRKQTDLLSLQNEIGRDVLVKLRTKLSGADEQRLAKNYTANTEAYQLYLKGRFYWNKRTVDDFRRATSYFQQAIDKDPNYALAYSGLADSYALIAVFGVEPPKDLMTQAKTAATKALVLDSNLSEAHASLGQIIMYYDWDFDGAEREFTRALELNPNYATAHQWRAENLSSAQRHGEALVEIRRALELDPMSPILNRVYGEILLKARRYDEAIDQLHKTSEIEPNFPTTHAGLRRAYEAKGMYDQAVEEALASPGPGLSSPETRARLKEIFSKSGWNAFLQMRLNVALEKSKKDYVRPFFIANLFARLGKKDEAFAWLEKAFQDRDYQMTELKVREDLDPLRSDSRFTDLLQRVGFAQ